ncbi:hypothetical protein NDU88_010757 [Pleurodeles waltl]|uniref:Uncharacterized protein n=1 Tax=Pleurodeles waltl TaxID=8319 RepID=A0AAV7PZP0_PLEWA|nr:hypothetical protein NDU88_010757 [Pleurodeles waltl]
MESSAVSNDYTVSGGPQKPAQSPPWGAGNSKESDAPVDSSPGLEEPHLLYSILTMLLCCPPIGLGALVYSKKTIAANQEGDVLEACRASNRALTLNRVALGIGSAMFIAAISYLIFGILAKWDFYRDPRTYKFYLG